MDAPRDGGRRKRRPYRGNGRVNDGSVKSLQAFVSLTGTAMVRRR